MSTLGNFHKQQISSALKTLLQGKYFRSFSANMPCPKGICWSLTKGIIQSLRWVSKASSAFVKLFNKRYAYLTVLNPIDKVFWEDRGYVQNYMKAKLLNFHLTDSFKYFYTCIGILCPNSFWLKFSLGNFSTTGIYVNDELIHFQKYLRFLILKEKPTMRTVFLFFYTEIGQTEIFCLFTHWDVEVFLFTKFKLW